MKQLLIAAFLFLSVTAFSQDSTTAKSEKVYTIKFTETEIQALYNTLEFTKSALPTSDAKAKDVTQAIQGITKLEAVIAKQYQAQNKK